MLDIKFIREHPDKVKENIKKKFQDEKIKKVDELLKKDKQFKKLLQDSEKLRAERNKITAEINSARKSGKDISKLVKKAKSLPDEIKAVEEKKSKLNKEIRDIIYKIPNIIHESVPIGKDDSENVEIKKIGKPLVPSYDIPHHVDISENLKGLDLESSRDTSGHGFYFLTGEIAMLHTAILNFARDYMIKKGFTYVLPPFMIREDVVNGVMSFEEKDVMMYKIQDEDLYLIGTSEHSMIGRFISKIIDKKELPLKLTSYSACFRKESGEHGIEEKGLYRVHQFEKQEMITICEPEDSYKLYEKMLNITVDVFKQLEIPIRKLEICSGDLADLKTKSADIEAWSPRQKKYFEVGSCSNLTDAQARRLNIRVDDGKEKYFPHTLNNTVLASPRALIAFLENHYQKDGSIKIPKALHKYMNGIKIIKKR